MESMFSLKICKPMSDDKKSMKFSLSLFRPRCDYIKKSWNFPHVYFILSLVRSISCCIWSSFWVFLFLVLFKIFIIKNYWCFRQSKNNIFIRDNSFFCFLCFQLPFQAIKHPIKRSLLIVCVVFVPTFGIVLAVNGLFGKNFP